MTQIPTQEETQLAIKETKLIWERMAQTGCLKDMALSTLHNEGKLSKSSYHCACPLCDLFLKKECEGCPIPVGWRELGIGQARCCSHTEFIRYIIAGTEEQHQKAAKDFYEKILLPL